MAKKSQPKTKKSTDTLTVVASVIAVAAVGTFFGYLVGMYAIGQVTGPEPSPRVDKVEVSESVPKPLSSGRAQPPVSNPPRLSAPVAKEKPPVAAAAKPAATPTVLFKVQVGAFSERANADSLVKQLKEKERLEAVVAGAGPYRVQVGAFSQKDNAESLASQLKAKGYPVLVVTSN